MSAFVSVLVGAGAGVVCAPLLLRAARALMSEPGGRLPCRWGVVVGAAVAGAAVSRLLSWPLAGVYAVFAAAVLVVAVVDAGEHRIPNVLTYPLLAAAVLALPWLGSGPWWRPAAGAAAAGVWALLVALVADQGPGDVKLAAAIGGWLAGLGWTVWAAGVLFGQILIAAAVATAVLSARRRAVPLARTPLGPALAAGGILALLAEAAIR